MAKERLYKYNLSELVDRLSINQLKEIKIPEHKQQYAQEIKEILHDIDAIIEEENLKLSAELIRDIVILSQFNNHIWCGESNIRKGIKEGNQLELSHSLNGVRNRAKNKIQSIIGGRKDHKVDTIGEEFTSWEPSW